MRLRETAVSAVSEPEKKADMSTSAVIERISGQYVSRNARAPSIAIKGVFP
jgi:hypothetical protein